MYKCHVCKNRFGSDNIVKCCFCSKRFCIDCIREDCYTIDNGSIWSHVYNFFNECILCVKEDGTMLNTYSTTGCQCAPIVKDVYQNGCECGVNDHGICVDCLTGKEDDSDNSTDSEESSHEIDPETRNLYEIIRFLNSKLPVKYNSFKAIHDAFVECQEPFPYPDEV